MSMPIMPNTIAEQDKTANAIGTKYLMPNDLENTMIDSILNDESLSMDQKRRLLDERMANLPPEQREKLEALKQMDDLDWGLLALMPGANWASRKIFEHARLPKIVQDNLSKLHKFQNTKSTLFEIGQGLKDNAVQAGLKETITRGNEAVKELPHKKQELEYEILKLAQPKIPYIDY
jgi:hypothetical protein